IGKPLDPIQALAVGGNPDLGLGERPGGGRRPVGRLDHDGGGLGPRALIWSCRAQPAMSRNRQMPIPVRCPKCGSRFELPRPPGIRGAFCPECLSMVTPIRIDPNEPAPEPNKN